jgi:hypothetical protein
MWIICLSYKLIEYIYKLMVHSFVEVGFLILEFRSVVYN